MNAMTTTNAKSNMNTTVAPIAADLYPLADLELQKWREKKCVARTLMKVTKDEISGRTSIAKNPKQKVVDGNLKENWSLAVASGYRFFLCRAPVDEVVEYMPDMAERIANNTFENWFDYPAADRIELDVPYLNDIKDGVKEIKSVLKQKRAPEADALVESSSTELKCDPHTGVYIESSRSRLFAWTQSLARSKTDIVVALSSMPYMKSNEVKYDSEIVWLNADYLIDALTVFPDAKFYAKREKPGLSGVLMESQFGKGVIMPVRQHRRK